MVMVVMVVTLGGGGGGEELASVEVRNSKCGGVNQVR